LKRRYILLGLILILAATLLIEYYTNWRFPKQDLILVGVPTLEIGKSQTFSYDYQLERVGTYSYTITGKEGELYTMVCNTDVNSSGQIIHLESNFIFNDQYKPNSYLLTVLQGDEVNMIDVSFENGNVISKVSFNNDTVTTSNEFPEGTFLVENNMPGLWEILLISSNMEQGQRYNAMVFIPQGGSLFNLEFYVNNDLQTLNLNGEQYSCTVIQESRLELRFYIYEGTLLQMRNENQDVIFTRLLA